MKGEKSWTRIQYEIMYRDMRFFGDRRIDYLFIDNPPEIVRAADYSYQAFDYKDNAWMSDERNKRFNVIKHRILTQREVFPF